MGIMRFLARVLLAPLFIYGGWDVLRNPAPRVQLADKAGTPQPDTAVKANAALMVGAGVCLLLGIAPRLAAAALAFSLIPTTYVGHQFWTKEGQEQKQQVTHFLKNLATLGGLLLLATAPGGKRKQKR